MRTLLLLLLLLLPSLAHADFAANVCRAAKNLEPITTDGRCTGYIARDAKGREVHRASGFDISGSMFASRDGRSVILVQHYPTLTDDVDQQPGVIVLRDGKRRAAFTIGELVQQMQLTTESISHLDWLHEMPTDLALGTSLVLVTSSQRRLAFDVAKGTLATRDLWSHCHAIAQTWKPITKGNDGLYTMSPARVIGATATKVQFALRDDVTLPTSTTSIAVCLDGEPASWIAVAAIPAYWNRR
jgi:hypothetical protein